MTTELDYTELMPQPEPMPLDGAGEPIPIRLIIIHDTDADGISAAWCINYHMQDQFDCVLLIPQRAGINDIPEGLTENDEVFLVDRTYPWTTLIKLADSVFSVTVLDHHKSAKDSYYNDAITSGLYELNDTLITDSSIRISYGNILVFIDTTHAACMLAWNYGCNASMNDTEVQDATPPWFIQYIEDRDMWCFKLPNSKIINAGMYYRGHTFDNYTMWYTSLHSIDCNYPTWISVVASDGVIVEATQLKLIKGIAHGPTVRYLSDTNFTSPTGELTLAVVCCPFSLISDLGDYILNYDFEHTPDDVLGKTPVLKVDAVLCYNWTEKGYVYSIRSKHNMLWLAKLYGGGGHKDACGFTTSVPPENVLRLSRLCESIPVMG